LPKLDHEKHFYELADEAEEKGYASTGAQTVVVKSNGITMASIEVEGNMGATALRAKVEEVTGMSLGPGTGGLGQLVEFDDEKTAAGDGTGSGAGGGLHPNARADLGLVPAARY